VRATNNRRLALSARDAWEDVKRYFPWNPLALDPELMAEARAAQQRHRLSWRDATLVAAARSPFTLEVDEPRAFYEVRVSA
jgi:hypothetical protein